MQTSNVDFWLHQRESAAVAALLELCVTSAIAFVYYSTLGALVTVQLT